MFTGFSDFRGLSSNAPVLLWQCGTARLRTCVSRSGLLRTVDAFPEVWGYTLQELYVQSRAVPVDRQGVI